jgi:FMN phosphatase YigB (HAD superfamily)
MHEAIRLVCFDLGGVLVRIARGWDDAWRRAGVDYPFASAEAWARHHELMLRFETGDVDEPGYLTEAPAIIPAMSPNAIVKVFDAWLLGMYPGAVELLDELSSRGVKTACLSNTNARHWNTLSRIEEYKPLERLDHRLASHELKVMKPNEGAYRKAEEATGFGAGRSCFSTTNSKTSKPRGSAAGNPS